MSLTIRFDVPGLGLHYDLLEDCGHEEIQAVLDLMIQTARSARWRTLAAMAAVVLSDGVPASSLPAGAVSLGAGAAADPVGSADGGGSEFIAHCTVLRRSDYQGKIGYRAMPSEVPPGLGVYGVFLPDSLHAAYQAVSGLSDFSAVDAKGTSHALVKLRLAMKDGKWRAVEVVS